MLVSGVWRLWLTPRRKSSLAASSSRSWAFWRLDPGEQLGVPDRDRDLAGEQLEQVLVGPLPRRVAGRWPTSTPELLAAGAEDGPDGRDSPGIRSSRGTVAGSTRTDLGVDHAERRRARRSRPRPAMNVGAVARRRRCSMATRGSARARGCAARGRAARRLWLSARRASSSSPGTSIGVERSPAEARSTAARDRPERRRQVGGEEVGEQDRDQRGEDEARAGATRPSVASSTARAPSRSTTAPKTASGRIAAATSPMRETRPERQRRARAHRIVAGGHRSSTRRGSRRRRRATARPRRRRAGRRRTSGPIGVATVAAGGRHRRRRAPSARRSPGRSVGRRAGSRRRGPSGGGPGWFGSTLELLAQAAHRDPDVGRVGVLGLGPAAGEQRLGRHGLAEVRGERVEQARLGRRELDGLAADGRLAPVEVEGQARARGRGCWRGTLSPSRRRTRLIRARSSG